MPYTVNSGHEAALFILGLNRLMRVAHTSPFEDNQLVFLQRLVRFLGANFFLKATYFNMYFIPLYTESCEIEKMDEGLDRNFTLVSCGEKYM